MKIVAGLNFSLFASFGLETIPQSHGQVANGAHSADLVIFICAPFAPPGRPVCTAMCPQCAPDAHRPRRSQENYEHVQNWPPRLCQQSVPFAAAVHAVRTGRSPCGYAFLADFLGADWKVANFLNSVIYAPFAPAVRAFLMILVHFSSPRNPRRSRYGRVTGQLVLANMKSSLI